MDQLVGTADQLQVVDMDKLYKENKETKITKWITISLALLYQE